MCIIDVLLFIFCILYETEGTDISAATVGLVVPDGSTLTEQGDVTVSQHQPSSFCAAKGFKPDWDCSGLVVLDQTGEAFARLETGPLLSNGLFSL